MLCMLVSASEVNSNIVQIRDKCELLEGPAVSGAQTYRELCLAAKNEEKRLAELKKRMMYRKGDTGKTTKKSFESPKSSKQTKRVQEQGKVRKCFNCGSTDHLIRDCKQPRKEFENKTKVNTKASPRAKMIVSEDTPETPLDFLYSSSSDDSDVCFIRVNDQGSEPRSVCVDIQGVKANGVIDTGADISIIGGDLFKKIAAVTRMKKKDFKPADKTPYTFDNKPFKLDGKINLDITFNGKTMCTPVYVKMDSHDTLLLSKGVCRQLGIVMYHSKVQTSGKQDHKELSHQNNSRVPLVRVRLVNSVRLQPLQSALVSVAMENSHDLKGPFLLEPTHRFRDENGELQFGNSLVEPKEHSYAQVLITNPTGITDKLEQGIWIGSASEATIISENNLESKDSIDSLTENSYSSSNNNPATVNKVTVCNRDVESRKRKLAEIIENEGSSSPWQERSKLHTLLLNHHQVFSLQDGDRGETDLVKMTIDTGDAHPIKQPVRRMPFAARQEVARQLREMQDSGVITPSHSPRASPVVLVRKKDGTLRFCIDFRALNSVTKADTFPLPRIGDLLDQLGKAHYFSTLDLASGYWQIKVHNDSREKTAFTTPQGLFEFRVMPFGLTNAPAVFQRLMQHVLMGLNPENGPDFVSVYIDDILVFSQTMEDHLNHLELVLKRLQTAGLMLKPTKCHFMRQEVEYLGHVITPHGVCPNPKNISAVKEFPTPQNVKGVQRFIGLASYYRRFIKNFAKIAHPLHQLTRKHVPFEWTEGCQKAFETLKELLTSPPLLAYPKFNEDFILETDASKTGLGAVLSQVQDDNRLHPVSYASRSLSGSEKNYGITELETLAVVWAIEHFHAYLYGQNVTVLTDHAAVKAVLNTPSPSGKHARWWTKVFGSGVRNVKIVYRSGKDNISADALSRQPHFQAPDEEVEQDEVQVAVVTSNLQNTNIEELLQTDNTVINVKSDFREEQKKDTEVLAFMNYLESKQLPLEECMARKVAAQALQFELIDGILYRVDTKPRKQRRVVVPKHLREQILKENHGGCMSGHFSGPRLYNALVRRWWWQGMYNDCLKFCKKCPQCTIVGGTGRIIRPPLYPIPVQRAFQILGVDIMDLPKTERGNSHVVVFQDFLTKWPLAFPVPDQKAARLVALLVDNVIPMFGVPEALLSDRGANLLSNLMLDICQLLGIRKLNTTAYHPQTDGMVERFNRTLKTMIRKHVDKFGTQWDKYLPGLLWAYRNTPHESTGEKPSFLLFGFDCRTPTEAAILPPEETVATDVTDYRRELMLSLTSAREIAAKSIQKAQKRYKLQYDKKQVTANFELGDWVFVRFPQDESGRYRKLSRPWHGPYRIVAADEPNVSVIKVYFPQDPVILVHLSRIQRCPVEFPAGYYLYGSKKRGPGRPPKWVDRLLREEKPSVQDDGRDTLEEPNTVESKEAPNEVNHQSNDSSESLLPPCRYSLRSRSRRALSSEGVM